MSDGDPVRDFNIQIYTNDTKKNAKCSQTEKTGRLYGKIIYRIELSNLLPCKKQRGKDKDGKKDFQGEEHGTGVFPRAVR